MKGKRPLIKIISYIHAIDKSYLPLLLLDNMLAAVTPFLSIIFSSRVLNGLLAKETPKSLMKVVLFFLILTGVVQLVRWGADNIKVVKENKIFMCLEQKIFDGAFTMDYEVLEKYEALDKVYKARDGVSAKGGLPTFCALLGKQITLVSKIIYAVIILTGLFTNSFHENAGPFYQFMAGWYGILPILLFFIILVMIDIRGRKKTGILEKEQFECLVMYNRDFGYFHRLVGNIGLGKDIRLYHMADMIEDEIYASNKKSMEVSRIFAKKRRKVMTPSKIGNMLFQLICNAYVGLKAIFGMITVGNVIKYVGSLLELGNSVGEIMRTYVDMEIYSGFYIYYIEFLEMENEKYEGTLPIEKRDDNEYELEFKDVSFRYPNSEKYALSHVSLKMKIGGKMAVVGKNGAGKTTFIKLLCRLYDPTEGEILLNGINIKYYDYDEYMRIFSVVFQDFKLFSFSLAENVAASWKYDKDRVAECLKQAGFEKRLQEMPEGIETNLYQMQDNGVEISGGEAQKVAIARALYKNSPVVILDEPTSALDPVSEYDIYKRFNELVKDKTAIYISHRMSSCRFCETVLVFDGGRIVQEGSHEQLVENTDGIYYKMWSAQAKYYQKG